jgi:hypothetical protein
LSSAKWIVITFALIAPMDARPEVYPPDAGIIDVTRLSPGEASRPFACADGSCDSTAAIRAGMDRCIERGGVLYFPAGVFRASDSIIWRRQQDGLRGARCRIVGRSREMTTLRLVDNAPGFGSAAVRKPFLALESSGGNGNEGPQNGAQDITIEIGAGNPGAVAIDFIGNNSCQMRDVLVRGAGLVGIATDRPSIGPCLFKRVEVQGFQRAILLGNTQFSLTILDMMLRDQTVAGIDFSGNQTLAIEGLRSTNTVPAILYTAKGNGMLTVVDSQLMSPAPSARAAIEVASIPAPNVRHFLLRDVETRGYQSALKVGAVFFGVDDISEMPSNPYLSLYPTELASLRLPVERAPEPFVCGPNDWARPMGPATQSQDTLNDSAAIQAALDSGKPCIYLPKTVPGGSPVSEYRLGAPLRAPSTARVLDALGNFLKPSAGFPAGQPMIQVVGEDCAAEPLTIRNVWGAGGVFPGTPYWIEHASPRTLVVADSLFGAGNRGIRTRTGAGKLFVENVAVTNVELNGTQIWAWQLNPEFFPAQVPASALRMVNATARVLGMKTEQNFVHVDQSGGSAEILGGFFMPGVGTSTSAPTATAYVLRNGARSFFNSLTWSSEANNEFPRYVEETRGAETRTLLPGAVDTPACNCTRSFLTGYRSGE